MNPSLTEQFQEILANFHLMRPEYLWAILPALLLLALLARKQMAQHSWQSAVDPELLKHLLNGEIRNQRRWPLGFVALALSIGVLAMAGPSWEKVNIPVHKRSEALVIALDLSISMYAEDTKPSRIKQAQYKIRDLLKQRKEGQTALVVFAGDAFVVAPLTDDVNTLTNMLSTLEPRILPAPGSNPLSAIKKADELLAGAGVGRGRVLLVTDGVMEYQLAGLEEFLENSKHSLSILALGTKQGAPIPAPNGGFLKDQTGEIIVPKLDAAPLRKLAKNTGGRYQSVRLDDKDVAALLAPESAMLNDKLLEQTITLERNFDTWQDAGFYLVIALLPLSLLLFRRGWLLCLPFLVMLPSEQANAFEWQDLWKTKNQQATEAMQAEDYEQASKLFETPDWRAAAEYRAGNYEAAAELYNELYQQQPNSVAAFNRGNALAKAGKLPDALKSYEQALEHAPNNADAQKNYELVKALLEQQEKEKQDQKSDDKQDGEGEKNEDSQDQQQGDGEQQEQQQGDGEQKDQESDQQQEGDQQKDQQSGENGDQSDQEQQSGSESQDQKEQEQQGEEKAQQGKEGEEQTEEEKQQAQQAEAEKAAEEAAAQQAMMQEAEDMDTEEKQALRQWLRQVPDDPSGLLRRKFNAQHQQRQERGEQQERRDVAPY